MNEGKWNEISPEDQAAIEGVSGLAFAELVGKAWNDADAAAIGKIEEAGIEIYSAPEPVLDGIKTFGGQREAGWAESLGEGYDGTAALARLRGMTGAAQ
jgi:TRAP-type C4-dicarboxylate transport system substrate-binding protein